ncbi:hypothetical protein HMPREF1870_00800 [Bacteroidales bacterium KA00344]|nr:hypothetical protein HMPREF1870_00800 [Bacteroidales bacterium KA00344]
MHFNLRPFFLRYSHSRLHIEWQCENGSTAVRMGFSRVPFRA